MKIIKFLALSLLLVLLAGCEKLGNEFGKRGVYFSVQELNVTMNLYDEEKNAPSINLEGVAVYRSGVFEVDPTIQTQVVVDTETDLSGYKYVVPMSMVQSIESPVMGDRVRSMPVKIVLDRQAMKLLDEDHDWYMGLRLKEPTDLLNPELSTCLVKIHFI